MKIFPGIWVMCFMISFGAFAAEEIDSGQMKRVVGVKNVPLIRSILEQMKFASEEKNGELLVKESDFAGVLYSLRESGFLEYDDLWFQPENGNCISVMNSSLKPLEGEGWIRMTLFDNIDPEKMALARKIVGTWGIPWCEYRGGIAVEKTVFSKVRRKFSQNLIFERPGKVVIMSTTVNGKFQNENEKQKIPSTKEERRNITIRRELISTVFNVKDIYDAEISEVSRLYWKIKVIAPVNFQWKESYKQEIQERMDWELESYRLLEEGEGFQLLFE